MKRKVFFQLIVVGFWIVFLPFGLVAATIGKGSAQIFNGNEGSARSQALNNALRDAVRKSVGLFLDSQTEVKNWTVIRDEIYASSQGFVKEYKVIKDEKDGNNWIIEIDAEVSSSDIKTKLSELRILHQKMGNKRLLVIYKTNHPNAIEQKHPAVATALASLQSTLLESGFRVFDPKTHGLVENNIGQRGAPVEAWVKIADQNQVDMIVDFELIADDQKPFSNSAFSAARTSMQLKCTEISTGRLIASIGTTQKQMTNARVGSFDWDSALSKASERAGKVAAIELIDNIIKYYETIGDIGNALLLVFKDFTEEETFIILDVLENLEGYQSMSELENIPLQLRLEYFSVLDKSRLRRKLFLDCKDKGIKLKTKEAVGNRIVFIRQ